MLAYAISYDGPVAIRFPRGEAYQGLKEDQAPIQLPKSELICEEEGIALLAVGSMVKVAQEVKEGLEKDGVKASLINVRFVSPIDTEILEQLAKNHKVFVTLEENVRSGGYGQKVSNYLCETNKREIRHINISIPDIYVEQGGVKELHEKLRLDSDSIIKKIKNSV